VRRHGWVWVLKEDVDWSKDNSLSISKCEDVSLLLNQVIAFFLRLFYFRTEALPAKWNLQCLWSYRWPRIWGSGFTTINISFADARWCDEVSDFNFLSRVCAPNPSRFMTAYSLRSVQKLHGGGDDGNLKSRLLDYWVRNYTGNFLEVGILGW